MKITLFKLLLWLGFVLLLFPSLAYSQNSNTVEAPIIIPSSPQSQVFEKYINHAITEYNGLPDITIPLYEIELDGLRIPIALTYHASGIQYMQHDGDIGAGWSINAAGYRISRSVNGKSDFGRPMYEYNFLQSYLTGTDKRAADDYMEAINLFSGNTSYSELDGEYDIFTYMTPSTNGHFILTGRNHASHAYTIANLDKKMDKLSMTYALGQLTDENGFKYDFGNKEGVTTPNIVESTYLSESIVTSTAWPLHTILSPFGRSVSFDYQMYEYVNVRDRKDPIPNTSGNNTKYGSMIISPAHVYEICYNDGNDNLPPDFTTNMWDIEIKREHSILKTISPYLTRIKGPKEEIEFVRTAKNGNLNTPSLVNEINIYDNSRNLIKKISFTYQYLSSASTVNTNTNAYPWHTVLTSVKIGNGNIIEKEYNLEYYLPPTNMQGSPDYWNYYVFGRGGGPNQDLFLPNSFANISFVSSIVGGNTIYHKTLQQYYGSNASKYFIDRSVNEQSFNSFSLKRITYPTGGYTEYEYELNQTSDGKGNGQRIKKITSRASANEEPIITVFKYGKNESGLGVSNIKMSNKHFIKSIRNISAQIIPPEGAAFMFLRDTSTITTFTNSSIDIPYESFTVYYPEVRTYQYNNSGSACNGKTISYYNIPSSSPAYSPMAGVYSPGLRPTLSSRRVYNNQNILLQKEDYIYQRTARQTYIGVRSEQEVSIAGTSPEPEYINSRLHWGYTYHHIVRIYAPFWGHIYSETDLLKSKQEVLYAGTDSLKRTENYTYNTQRNQLTKIDETQSNGVVIEKEFLYPPNDSWLITQNNMYAAVQQEIIRSNGSEIKRLKYNYPTDSTTLLPQPQSVDYSPNGANNFQLELSYLYDQTNGNLLQYTGRDSVPVSYLWGYKGQYPVAQIVGTDHATVLTKLNSTQTTILAKENTNTGEIRPIIDSLQRKLPAAQITGYSYIPLIGVSVEIAPNGLLTHYKYDSFGRLRRILDHNEKVVEQFQYHFANQNDLSIGEIPEYVAPPPPPQFARYWHEPTYSYNGIDNVYAAYFYRSFDDGRNPTYRITVAYSSNYTTHTITAKFSQAISIIDLNLYGSNAYISSVEIIF